DLRHQAAKLGLPRQPAVHASRRPDPVPPRRGGRAPAGVRRRALRQLPLPDRGQPLRCRRLSRVAADNRRRGRRAPAAARGSSRCHPGAMTSAEIIEGGLQTTVQDYPGRRGMLSKGFFPAGPMDHLAHRAANLLVGNPESAATLEITLGNFRMRFDDEVAVAVCGAEAPLTIADEEADLWESHRVAPGAEVSIGIAPVRGFRFYLAVSGGFDVPELFGSRATYTMGALGGYEGRSLQQGDQVPLGKANRDRPRRRFA